jgi:hypothetical protein
MVEIARVGVERQDPALERVVRDAGFAAQLAQAVTRVERELQALEGVAPRARRQALDEEAQREAPLRRVGAQPEPERRVVRTTSRGRPLRCGRPA